MACDLFPRENIPISERIVLFFFLKLKGSWDGNANIFEQNFHMLLSLAKDIPLTQRSALWLRNHSLTTLILTYWRHYMNKLYFFTGSFQFLFPRCYGLY